MVDTYTYQLSEEYQLKLNDKYKRYIKKYDMLKKYLGTSDDIC